MVTETIDISEINATRKIDVKLAVQGLSNPEMSDEIVSVTIHVGDSKVNRRFENVPVEVVGTDYRTTVRPKSVAIEIQGTPNTLRFVKLTDFRAFVEASDLAPGKHERDIRVKIPPETVLIETAPEKSILNISTLKRRD